MELEVVVGTYDGTIEGLTIDVVAPEEKGLRKKYHERDHTGCVKTVASSGRYLATGSTDETIKLYDLRRHVETGTLLQHEGSITWLSFHKESHLLSASEDGTICVWKCGGGWECLQTLTGHKYTVTCIAVHPSGKVALSVGRDRTLRTWDLVSFHGAFRQRLTTAAELVVWSPIGDMYVLSFDKTLVAYEVESGEVTTTIEVGKHINSLQFVQDTILAVGSDYPYIQLFSVTDGECIAKLEGHTNRVKGLAVSPGSGLLFSASSDGCVKTWRLAEPLEDSKCISSIDTGSRLTSITVVCPEGLLKELKQSPTAQPTTSAVLSPHESEKMTSEEEPSEKEVQDDVTCTEKQRPTSKTKRKRKGALLQDGDGVTPKQKKKNRDHQNSVTDVDVSGVKRKDKVGSSTTTAELDADGEHEKSVASSSLGRKLKTKHSRRKLLRKQRK